jgi:hypothetical protein
VFEKLDLTEDGTKNAQVALNVSADTHPPVPTAWAAQGVRQPCSADPACASPRAFWQGQSPDLHLYLRMRLALLIRHRQLWQVTRRR